MPLQARLLACALPDLLSSDASHSDSESNSSTSAPSTPTDPESDQSGLFKYVGWSTAGATAPAQPPDYFSQVHSLASVPPIIKGASVVQSERSPSWRVDYGVHRPKLSLRVINPDSPTSRSADWLLDQQRIASDDTPRPAARTSSLLPADPDVFFDAPDGRDERIVWPPSWVSLPFYRFYTPTGKSMFIWPYPADRAESISTCATIYERNHHRTGRR